MQFESEKVVGRVQDGLFYNALLSEINFILYKTFITYLPFYNEMMKFDNHIWSIVIDELNKKGISERVVSLYKDNKVFFEQKYGIKEKDLIEKTDTLEIANIVYYKILETIVFASSKDDRKYIFGINDSNIIPCPMIIKDQWLVLFNNVDYYADVADFENLMAQTYNLNVKKLEPSPKPAPPPPPPDLSFWGSVKTFFKTVGKALATAGADLLLSPVLIGEAIYDFGAEFFAVNIKTEKSTPQDINNSWQQLIPRYFFEKDYFDFYIKQNQLDATRGFHFETFVSFDFDRTKFDFSDELINELKTIDKDTDYQGYLYSFLNTAYFLPNGGKPIQNIVVNPDLFRQIFSVPYIDQNSNSFEKQHKVVEPHLKNFISNIRVGLRMVYRIDYSVPDADDFNTNLNYKYKSENEFISTHINDKTVILPSKEAYLKATDSNIPPQAVSVGFTQLEKKIIKDKSYFLYSKEGVGEKIVYTRHNLITNIIVTSNKFTGEITYKNINDFIDQQLVLEKLKNKLINKKDFKFIFEKVIPTDIISLIPKSTDAINKAVVLKNKMSKEITAMDLLIPENTSIYLAKTLEKTTESAINSMLKDKQKEY